MSNPMAEEQLDLEGKSVEDLKNLLNEKQSLLEQVTRERDKSGETIFKFKQERKQQEARIGEAEVLICFSFLFLIVSF